MSPSLKNSKLFITPFFWKLSLTVSDNLQLDQRAGALILPLYIPLLVVRVPVSLCSLRMGGATAQSGESHRYGVTSQEKPCEAVIRLSDDEGRVDEALNPVVNQQSYPFVASFHPLGFWWLLLKREARAPHFISSNYITSPRRDSLAGQPAERLINHGGYTDGR